jgi:hypothetical protein
MPKIVKKVRDLDPYGIDAKALRIADIAAERILKHPDKATFMDITRVLSAITRARYVQVVTAAKIQPEDEHVGSTARKYTASFQARSNAGGGGPKRPGTVPRPVPVPTAADDELGIWDDEDEQRA